MGGTADDDVVFVPSQRDSWLDDEKQYDAVVTLYAWAKPATWEVEELRYGFPDADLALADLDRLLRAARWAYERWQAGDRVLVRCQAGLNRSGLVTALVLMQDGYSPVEAIALIRLRRSPWALCNDDFVRWLCDEATGVLGRAA